MKLILKALAAPITLTISRSDLLHRICIQTCQRDTLGTRYTGDADSICEEWNHPACDRISR